MSDKKWPSIPYLDALRPEPGWHVEHALLASYSADLVALVAVLLALAGLDDDRGSGSKVDFANAVDQLNDRVRLVVQAGRIVAPAKAPKILAILDRYVREVVVNEQEASWHPKIALVKLQSDDNTEWRLWIGSRNLTRSMSWDIGLTLVGSQATKGAVIDGIPELGFELATRAALPGVAPTRLRSELRGIHWQCPAGCGVNEVVLRNETSGRDLPTPPDGLTQLVVISPFLDGTVIRRLGQWGEAGTRRLLISTQAELSKVAQQGEKPLNGFTELLYLDAPEPDFIQASDEAESENAASEDEEVEARGLHAKLILAQHAGGHTLWTGSANATQRGWFGPNIEIVAKAAVNRDVSHGLEVFVHDMANTVRLDELPSPIEPDEVEERLEEARKQVANRWAVTQTLNDELPFLNADAPPHPDDSEITLHVAVLGGSLILWTPNTSAIRLPQVAPGEQTELIQCCLRLEDKALSWLQRAQMDPPPDDDRDRQALARYLDPRTFLQWIRSLLTGDPLGDGGGDWDSDRRKTEGTKGQVARPVWWAPTIEEVLKSWSRDPGSLAFVDRKLQHYLKLYREQDDAERTEAEQRVIEEFHQTWQVIRRELVT
ncbi:MAG: phospholipase D family protein [Planctomycetes bacterium]|nr:phospholipase D family protein [Planctomycetota bacterium]